jgi:hypothetical protein
LVKEHTLQQWLLLDDQEIASSVAQKVSTAAVYVNGTRRWFLSQHQDWNSYAKIAGLAQRQLSQLLYAHGVQTLIQPMLGYDLLDRGAEYLELAINEGLAELGSRDYRDWYRQSQIRVTFYGNWLTALTELGFVEVSNLLAEVMAETRHHHKRRLLFGIFADEGLDSIVSIAQSVRQGEELINRYYGQPVGPVNLVIGSGQPAIWDLPLLDINKASLYFLQAPTFFLERQTLRRILYDHLYQRINDDDLYDNLSAKAWQAPDVLGLGQRTKKGWLAA